MNIKSAVFGLVSLKPQAINAIVKRLPYSQDSIYNAIEEMLKDGDLIKIKTEEGIRVDAPLELTWSCFKGLERPCLQCKACLERTEAFKLAGHPDPALTVEEWDQALQYLEWYKEV